MRGISVADRRRGPGGKIDKKKQKRAGPLENAGPVAFATFATRLIRYW